MRNRMLAVVVIGMACTLALADGPTYRKVTLSDKFYAEGAYFADFNKDGKMDVVAGPWWFEGPDFQKKHEYRPVKEFDGAKGYSDNFLTYCGDFNGDGWTDILIVPHPGQAGHWYENPQNKEGAWKQRLAGKDIGGESPVWADVDGDGRQDLVHCAGGAYGYSKYDPAKPDDPWTFVMVNKGGYGKYSHGQGAGDVNGDGKVDLLESGCWWEQPARAGDPWIKRPAKFANTAAQLLVADVDGDGLNDVITTVACHGYGLVWHKQVKNEKGEITFKENVILPAKPDLKSSDLRISQLHAFDYYMLDGKFAGFVTGKRLWAHGPKGDVEPDAPPVLYLFQLQRDKEKGASFAPVKIDDASGVGTQVTVVDLNGDKTPDIVMANKKGMFVFLSEAK